MLNKFRKELLSAAVLICLPNVAISGGGSGSGIENFGTGGEYLSLDNMFHSNSSDPYRDVHEQLADTKALLKTAEAIDYALSELAGTVPLGGAVYENGKMVGYFAIYLSTGDESSLLEMVKASENFIAIFEKMPADEIAKLIAGAPGEIAVDLLWPSRAY